MSRFEEIGVERIRSARTAKGVVKAASKSCAICCSRGFRMDCSSCAINQALIDAPDFLSPKEAEKFGDFPTSMVFA